jgi:hypothetical protein
MDSPNNNTSDNLSDDELYIDDNYVDDAFDDYYINDYVDNYICDNFDDCIIDKLTKDLNYIFKSLEKYQENPTEEIKMLKKTFVAICEDDCPDIIDKNPLLKILVSKVGDRINVCEILFDDIEYVKNLENKEKKRQPTRVNLPIDTSPTIDDLRQKYKDMRKLKEQKHKEAYKKWELKKQLGKSPKNDGNANNVSTGDEKIDSQIRNYKKFLDRV